MIHDYSVTIYIQQTCKAFSDCPRIPSDFCRFEKSLYDLIRGLRNHKGSEREYIQHSLRECRTEIRGSDMGALKIGLLQNFDTHHMNRPQSYSIVKAHLPRDVRSRYVLGILSCFGGHVLAEIHSKASGLSGSCAKFSTGHRGLDVGNESPEEGECYNGNCNEPLG